MREAKRNWSWVSYVPFLTQINKEVQGFTESGQFLVGICCSCLYWYTTKFLGWYLLVTHTTVSFMFECQFVVTKCAAGITIKFNVSLLSVTVGWLQCRLQYDRSKIGTT